jgi:hypothetical protein
MRLGIVGMLPRPTRGLMDKDKTVANACCDLANQDCAYGSQSAQ